MSNDASGFEIIGVDGDGHVSSLIGAQFDIQCDGGGEGAIVVATRSGVRPSNTCADLVFRSRYVGFSMRLAVTPAKAGVTCNLPWRGDAPWPGSDANMVMANVLLPMLMDDMVFCFSTAPMAKWAWKTWRGPSRASSQLRAPRLRY